jgi:two-component system, LytTR family, sensor kinase
MLSTYLKNKLFKIALLVSPILALYGVTPIYFFKPLPNLHIAYVFLIVVALTLLFWAVNILILIKAHHLKTTTRIVLSYCIVLLIHALFILLIPKPQSLPIELKFIPIYPVLFIIATNTIILFIINTVLLNYNKKSTEQELEHLKIINLEAQQQVLNQQLQPHFLFNALSVLKSLIHENPNEAENYTLKLSEFLRYSVNTPAKGLVPVAKELTFAQDYVALQKVRFEDALFVTFEDTVNSTGKYLPAYAIQTLIENAIKHNQFTEKTPLRVQVIFTSNTVSVINNKVGVVATGNTGIGLKNLQQRYSLQGADSGIDINDNNNFFKVTIKLLNA